MKKPTFNISSNDAENVELALKGISKNFPSGSETINVLEDINFTLTGGQTMSVTGPSGSGKSTLLNIIAALIRPDEGEISLGDEEYGHLTERTSSTFRASFIGMVFQDHLLIDHLSAYENILLGAMACGADIDAASKRADELLKTLDLADRREHLPGKLSGGQKQRVAIARALINSPKIVIADEPTGQLDSASSEKVTDLLFDCVKSSGAMLIIATHDSKLAQRAKNRYKLENSNLIESDI